MTSAILFLSGLVAAVAGVSVRSCSAALPIEFAQAWCGSAPHAAFGAALHGHCAGCAIAAAGSALMALAAWDALKGRSRPTVLPVRR